MEKILRYVYSSKKLKSVLNAVSDFSVPVFLGAFVALSFLSYMMGLVFFLKTLIFSAVAFILVTLVRRFIRAKRPYELYSFYKEKPRGKKGDSFPSRHVFSAFLIATLFYSFSLLASILLLAAVKNSCLMLIFDVKTSLSANNSVIVFLPSVILLLVKLIFLIISSNEASVWSNSAKIS